MSKTSDLVAAALATPIGQAVTPMRAVAMDDAEKRARARIAFVAAELAKVDFDINKAAPYPGYHETKGMMEHEKQAMKARYALFHSVVTGDKDRVSYGHNAPYFVVMSPERGASFVEAAREMASQQYDMFVFKLNRKVGAHVAAVLEGNHIWGKSFLTVSFAGDKPSEIWKTHQIWNVSKLGKDFPQWPSRKVKSR